MNNTSAIQGRMKSIRQTVQISNAQKLIAASRIGRAKRMLADSAPYHDRIRQSIAGVLAHSPDTVHNHLSKTGGSCERRGLLVITSDRGLAGGYNSNIIRMAEQSLINAPARKLVVLGGIGISHFSSSEIYTDEFNISVDPPTMFSAREISEYISSLFDDGEVDGFDVIYTHFISTVKLAPKEARLFPLEADVFGEPPAGLHDITFEPSPDSVLSMLMPKYLKGFIYGCLIHAWASELASRVTAMDSAIRNGNEMLDSLNLIFNRARQALITQEITEIVAGTAAMAEE